MLMNRILAGMVGAGLFCGALSALAADAKPPPMPPPAAPAPERFVPILLDEAVLGDMLRWADDELTGADKRKLMDWLNIREIQAKAQQRTAPPATPPAGPASNTGP
jgi:hypothetical protein